MQSSKWVVRFLIMLFAFPYTNVLTSPPAPNVTRKTVARTLGANRNSFKQKEKAAHLFVMLIILYM